jgi:hypothetical protein
MNNELERIWKEVAWPNLRYYPGICLEGQENHKKPVRTAGHRFTPTTVYGIQKKSN